MADVTPPVGLAAYAAAAISGADPVKTGIQGFRYEIRTGLLPFIFIFNSELLLIDIGGVWNLLLVASAARLAPWAALSRRRRDGWPILCRTPYGDASAGGATPRILDARLV